MRLLARAGFTTASPPAGAELSPRVAGRRTPVISRAELPVSVGEMTTTRRPNQGWPTAGPGRGRPPEPRSAGHRNQPASGTGTSRPPGNGNRPATGTGTSSQKQRPKQAGRTGLPNRRTARNRIQRGTEPAEAVPGTGNREPGTGNREPGTGNREPGTGNRPATGTGNRPATGTGNREPAGRKIGADNREREPQAPRSFEGNRTYNSHPHDPNPHPHGPAAATRTAHPYGPHARVLRPYACAPPGVQPTWLSSRRSREYW